VILSQDTSSGSARGFELAINATTDVDGERVYRATSTLATATGAVTATNKLPLEAGHWYHVTAGYSVGEGSLVVVVKDYDNLQEANSSPPAAITSQPTAGGRLRLAHSGGTTPARFSGTIDEIQVFTLALDETTIGMRAVDAR
jgi:hypothetical protein